MKRENLSLRGHPSLLKLVNKNLVLNTIKQVDNLSRYDIAKKTRLSPNTVGAVVDELIQEKLVLDMGIRKTPFGRKPRKLKYNPDVAFVIAVEIETHGITAARINLDGRIVQIKQAEVDGIYEQDWVIGKTMELADKLMSQELNYGSKILGMALGVTGFVDNEKGIGTFSPPFGWRNVQYKEMFENRFQVPVYVENVNRFHAMGENMFGAGKNEESLFYVEVEWGGIGGGIILNNVIYRGPHGSAGEIGHSVVVDDGSLCHCGNRGCLETVVNERKLIALAEKNGVFSQHNGNDKPCIGNLIKAAEDGNSSALNLLADAAKHFARVVANVINALDPIVVVFNGELFRSGDIFFELVKKDVIVNVFNVNKRNLRVEISHLGNRGCVLGGGAWILHQLSNDWVDRLNPDYKGAVSRSLAIGSLCSGCRTKTGG